METYCSYYAGETNDRSQMILFQGIIQLWMVMMATLSVSIEMSEYVSKFHVFLKFQT